MDQPRAVVTTRNRFQALAAMEPKLRDLYNRSVPVVPESKKKTISLGRKTLDFVVNGQEVRFWLTDRYVTLFSGVLDPVVSGKYCEGRIHIHSWSRGDWEAELGAKVETFDPLTTGVLPKKLINQIRTGLKCWPVLAPDSERALDLMMACLHDPLDAMLKNVLARDVASDDQLHTLMRLIPHPNFALAVTLVLALNFARPSHVQRALEICRELSLEYGEDCLALAERLAGSSDALDPVWDYMVQPSPTDDEAELARDLFSESFLGVVDPDGTRAGQIIDRMALALKKRGI